MRNPPAIKDSCGVVGVFGHKNAARLAYLALYALQHRGEESCGIASFNGKIVCSHKGMGLVGDVFKETELKKLKGNLAVGHVRYSTTGTSDIRNAQPFTVHNKRGYLSVAHNGNLTNSKKLRAQLENEGSIFQTGMDSEIVLHLLVKDAEKSIEERFKKSLLQLEGAYSFVMMANNCLFGMRDPRGFKPLCLGKIDGAYVLVSETCALDIMGASYIRDIEPGEIVRIDNDGVKSIDFARDEKHAFCIFENIYFARPDSSIFRGSVYETRKNLGRALAREYPVDADFIMPVPDSGTIAALGYAEESGLPLEMAMVRNHYVGRTFIQPSQLSRDFKVKVKLNPVGGIIKDKRIVIVEDSIVRGTTSKGRVRALRKAGAKEIHMRISCPPLISPCYYGIDFPTKKELIAFRLSEKEIGKFIGVDSLKYLSLEGMLKSMQIPGKEFCNACFTGIYPTPIKRKPRKKDLEGRNRR